MGSLRPFAVPIGPIIFHVVPKPRIVSKGSGARCSSRDERGMVLFQWGEHASTGAQARFPGRHAALPAPLTQRRRSDARRRHPRLRRRELHAARAATRSRWTRCGTATAHPLPPFEHQPADTQATATHRARAAPPQEPARGQQRPPSTPSRSATSTRGEDSRRAWPPTLARAHSGHCGRTLNSK